MLYLCIRHNEVVQAISNIAIKRDYVAHEPPRISISQIMARSIEQEKRTVEQMIHIYCRGRHRGGSDLCSDGSSGLCPNCQALLDYAHLRLSRCRFADDKPTCKRCPVHCYRPEMREQIREVMRYAGPRMLLYHPIAAIRHLLSSH